MKRAGRKFKREEVEKKKLDGLKTNNSLLKRFS